MMRNLFLIVLSACLVSSCQDKKKLEDNPLLAYRQEYIYFLHEDSANMVQCMASFRKESEYGEKAVLAESFRVLLDGEPVVLEDTATNLVYYRETTRENVDGPHRWEVKQADRLLSEVLFTFRRFTLDDRPASLECGDADLSFRVSGLAEGDSVECWFDNTDINNDTDRFTYLVHQGAFTLLRSDMGRVKGGHYQLRISHNQSGPVLVEGKNKGKWETSYILDPIPTNIH